MKERIYQSLPFVLVILGTFGVLITDELWVAIVSLAGVWLLPSPVVPVLTVKREDVSRETFADTDTPNVSRETITSPCAFLHGSAEPHVPGCEGWTFDLP